MSVLAFAFFFFKLVYNKDKNNLEFNNKCSHKAKSNKNNHRASMKRFGVVYLGNPSIFLFIFI